MRESMTARLDQQQQLASAREDYRRAKAGERMSQVRAPISGTVTVLNAEPDVTGGAGQHTFTEAVLLLIEQGSPHHVVQPCPPSRGAAPRHREEVLTVYH